MSGFNDLVQLKTDYEMTWDALKRARDAANEVKESVSTRIEREKKQIEERAAELENIRSDMLRSETVRKMAEIELSRIDEYVFDVVPEEAEAFYREIKIAEQAARGLKEIQRQTKKAIDEAEGDIRRIRSEILGDETPELAPRWISGIQEGFARLYANGEVEE